MVYVYIVIEIKYIWNIKMWNVKQLKHTASNITQIITACSQKKKSSIKLYSLWDNLNFSSNIYVSTYIDKCPQSRRHLLNVILEWRVGGEIWLLEQTVLPGMYSYDRDLETVLYKNKLGKLSSFPWKWENFMTKWKVFSNA